MQKKIHDISIDDLKNAEILSIKAVYICKQNNLPGLNSIVGFYNRNGNFKKLQNCGEAIQIELTNVCKKLANLTAYEVLQKVNENSDIRQLISLLNEDEIKVTNAHIEFLIYSLSNRSRNGLLRLFNGIPDVKQLIEKIFSTSFSFSTMRSIGARSTYELDELKESLSNYLNVFLAEKNRRNEIEGLVGYTIIGLDPTPSEIFNALNPYKKAALYRHIDYLISNLKVRAKNGLTNLLGGTYTAKELIETIFSNAFNFLKIKNIGSKSVLELNLLKAEISSFLATLRFIDDDQLSRKYARLIVKTTFSDFTENFNDQFETVFETTGKIRLFRLIHFLIENGHILEQKERELFYFLYTEGYNKSLDQIATELELGKERLRQIRNILEGEVKNYFRFILSFDLQDLVTYNISEKSSFQIIDDEFAKNINFSEGVKFNNLFYSIVFGLFLENSHTILGDNENISGSGNYSSTIRYKNRYLIEKYLFRSFSFETFVNDINLKLTDRITETYSLYFDGYLLQFISTEGKKHLRIIREMCEAIIYNEFELVTNSEGYIMFERNQKKLVQDYVIEILEELGEMTKIESIAKAINRKYPELATTEQSVRGTLTKEKELFIYIGRTSTYGLAKWQNERPDLKGGTIRSLTEQYLVGYNEPKHISDISLYILKFRPKTYERSVLDNLKADTSGKFIFLGKGLVGLSGLKYSESYLGLKRIIRDWNENYQELRDFRMQNTNAWPSSLSQEKSERALYNFLYRNKVAYHNNKLDAEKIALLRQVGFFDYLTMSRASDWHVEFDKLRSFILINNKLPSSNSSYKAERALYRFLYINRQKIKNNELEFEKSEVFKRIIN